MVVTAHGYFLQYSIDMEQGGECVLLKQYSLLPDSNSSNSGSPAVALRRRAAPFAAIIPGDSIVEQVVATGFFNFM